jgi:YfiH family protein
MTASGWIRPDWPAPAAIRALTTTRALPGRSQPPFERFNLGARCGDDPAAVAHNRAQLIALCGLPAPPRWLQQVHGVGVVRDPGFDEPVADAAVTDQPGHVLAILSADCLPVVFAARDGREVAVAHAGWRGLAAGVLEATIAAMRTPADALLAWLGPAAGPARYEVGDEVRAAFVERDARAAGAFTPTRPGHWHVDLYALARQRLVARGVPAAQVFGGAWCTIGDAARFYSHRRDGRSGRMATLAWIRET